MTISETFNQIRTESERCGMRLCSELKQTWESLRALLVQQADVYDHASKVRFESILLENLDSILSLHAQRLLIEPTGRYRRERFQQRVSEAFGDYDRAMEGVILAMPEFLNLTASEWRALTGKAEMSFRSRFRLRWSRKPRQVSFRQNLLCGFHLRRAGRMKLEGRLMKLMAECSLELMVPWQAQLQVWLPQAFSRGDYYSSDFHKEPAQFRHRLVAYQREAEGILDGLSDWATNGSEKIASRAPFLRRASRSPEELEKLAGNYFRQREFCERQSRAVDTEIDLDFRLATAELEINRKARQTLEAIETEHRELLKELSGVVSWLANWKQSDVSTFPPAAVRIVSASNRMNAWAHAVDRSLDQVPETVEVTSRLKSKPTWRRTFRTHTPRLLLRQALERHGDAVVREGLGHLERHHRGMIREIERAREVVAFAAETAQLGKASDLQVEREGMENARSLLEFHRRQAQDVPPQVERSLVSALAAGFLRTHTLLESGQFSVARQAARHGLPAVARKVSERLIERLREKSAQGARGGVDLYRETLIRIGWIPAPTARIPHVITRGSLSSAQVMESQGERLPMIYERLFRLDPVEDPRFLIGRQDEMNALVAARNLWEQNREAAVIVVGERGSGNTSLLNCAVQTTLAGSEIIRSDFSKRLTSSDEMFGFLGGLLAIEPHAVENTLNSGKRVIILEELERTYLRRVNHFEALRGLLNLISKTSRNTLWIMSINYFAFRLLNASLRLDPHFSHRINAMAVDRDHLREAVLMRHNLSGLRLRFAPAPSRNHYVDRFKRIAGVEVEPEIEFFDALYRESGGVFRTAFALWQRCIDRSDAGLLYMRCPGNPQHDDMIKSLNDLDLFTLAAILQHGSLTPEEHSIVFQIDQATSNAWVDNLLARGLIQPDPGRSGLRVVPEAGEIIRRTLFSRNVA
jgi:hypothetical protein